MESNASNSPSTKSRKMDLYARAAATLYGIISFDDFCKILDAYYGEGTLSKERIASYFQSAKNDDPIYYTQDKLIVHASIAPDEVTRTFSEIQNPVGVTAPARHWMLPEKEFLQYANPFFYEDLNGTRKMEAYLTDDLGLLCEDAREIVGGDSIRLPQRRLSHADYGCPRPAGVSFWAGVRNGSPAPGH